MNGLWDFRVWLNKGEEDQVVDGPAVSKGGKTMTLLTDPEGQFGHLDPVCVRTANDVFVCRIIPVEKRALPTFQDQVAVGPYGYSRFHGMLDAETCGLLEQAVGLYRTRKRSHGRTI